MAHGKGRGARDVLYGRRGGGWLPQGFDPTAPVEPVEKLDDAKREALKAQQRAAVVQFEHAHDLVPGTAQFGSRGPTGGQSWEGRARMAAARRDTGAPLDAVDREALDRHPVTTGEVAR